MEKAKPFLTRLLDGWLEPVTFAVVFYLLINRIIFGGGWITLSGSTLEKVLPESIMWILVCLVFLRRILQNQAFGTFVLVWRKNWVLMGFMLLALCSLLWTEDFLVTLYKVIVLIACSLVSAYIGTTFPGLILLRKFFWFLMLVVSVSYGLALLIPAVGTHIGYPYFGAWRGLFFAKNYMGAVMAFGTIIYLFMIFSVENGLLFRLSSVILYLLTTGLVFFSRSATGILLFFILNAGFMVVAAWVRWKNRLHIIHYIILGIFFTGMLILTVFNLDFVFGLLNRNTSLTGRVPLWSFLFNSGISDHLFFGKGFGATWINDQFRLTTQAAIGWEYAPLVSDNGLVDIFLNLGLVGVMLLLATVLLTVFRVVRYALKKSTLISFFPAFGMVFFLVANISLSFILELESFAWFFMVFALFSTTQFPPVVHIFRKPGE
jgi:exopolysaccharide production protein ExoQ